LKAVPKDSAAYRRYLDKFGSQETQVEKLQAEIKQLWGRAHQAQKAYEDYVADLHVD
jgi:predicted P-loop ATPase